MKSLASSASLVVVRIVFAARRREQRGGPFGGRVRVRADDLGQRCAAPRARGPRRSAPGRRRRRRGSRGRRGAGRRTRWCPDRRCCAGRRAASSRRCGAIWSTAFSKMVIDGPRNSSTGVPMTTTRRIVRSIIAPSAPKAEPAGRQQLAEELVRAGLEERHLARRDPIQGRLVRVVDADPQAGLGEGEAQRQADVAPAAEDDDVEIGGLFRHGLDSSSLPRASRSLEGPGGGLVLGGPRRHSRRSHQDGPVRIRVERLPTKGLEANHQRRVVGIDDRDRHAPGSRAAPPTRAHPTRPGRRRPRPRPGRARSANRWRPGPAAARTRTTSPSVAG